MTNIHTNVMCDQRADFGMRAFGRVRVSSLRALPLTVGVPAWGLVAGTATAIAQGDFPGSHAWSPPS